MRETEKRNGSCAVERGRREEMKPLRSGWMLAACRSAIEMSRQGAAKGHVWVLDPTTARACVGDRDLYCHQGPQGCPVTGLSSLAM